MGGCVKLQTVTEINQSLLHKIALLVMIYDKEDHCTLWQILKWYNQVLQNSKKILWVSMGKSISVYDTKAYTCI